jgi:tetratricopeptide (TPR) repeat protein
MRPRTVLNPGFAIFLSLAVISASGCGGAETRKAKHMAKGQTFLDSGNFEKARVEFQNALQIAPTDADARFESGLANEKLGKARDAAQYYQGAIDVRPDHVGARTHLARLYLFSGAPDRALELVKPALQAHPDDPDLLTVRAAARVQQKNVSEAQIDAERAVQLAPTNEDAVAVLAGVYTSNGQKDKAQALLEQSIAKIPATVDLRLVLAQIYAQENRLADSEALLIKLVDLKPNDKSHRIRLAQYYAGLNQTDAAERTLREALKVMPAERDLKVALVEFLGSRRSHDAAEKELKAMIAADPKDHELKFALGRFYEQVHQPQQAEPVYQAVIDSDKMGPAGLTARTRLAALMAQRNDVAGALALVNVVLGKSPRDTEALTLRGDINLAKQDPRAAIADLRAVLRDQPNAVGVLRMLSQAHLANGEPAIAEETMRQAVEQFPQNAALRLDLVQLLAQLGKPEQAKPIIAELVKQKPDSIEALDAQVHIALATKDLVTAKSAAQAIVATRPKAWAGYYYEGMIAESEQHTDEALRRYSDAEELQADAPEPLKAHLRLLVSAKREGDALKRLDDLAARYPNVSLALELKGELLFEGGHAVEARDAYQAAITRTPKWWVPYRGLAYAHLAMQEPDVAVKTLRDALPIVTQRELLGAELAGVLERVGKPDEAIHQYEEMLYTAPQSEIAANNLAMLLATYKQDHANLDRAKQLSARFANSANPVFMDTYGWVLYKLGESAASVPVLERVVEKAPDAALARYHLGMAQSKIGSNSQARDNLQRAVSSGRKFSGLDEAKATLDKLATSPATTASVPKT